MNTEEIVRALRKTCGGCNPTPCCELEVLGPAAADLIETPAAQPSASQAREREAEIALEEMTYIIQKAAYRRCDYCIYRTEPCPARGLHTECDFEYAGERGPQAGGGAG